MAGYFPAISMNSLNFITTEDVIFPSFGGVAKIQRIFDGWLLQQPFKQDLRIKLFLFLN
ncbi:Uncharacterised protein [Chryseobacterium gleum]|uniref:Uncharacterized protein n=2 Tax=Chryseobacterium gleum TaxID=250 RepID=A0A3S4R268_CHRGE|nr:hypothetical protein HMPREF0204_12188 [Chryseobacterium gleum ATCC 35910]VEE07668.1 Uncharacterised protein [Chryseobacterium gleum]